MLDEKNLIRVLIVEDSPTISQMLTQLLNENEDIGVVGVARNGKQAISMTEQLRPDIITMDINLPIINGLEATKYIMAYFPTPILVITSGSQQKEMDMSFNAMSLGALDIIEKSPIEEANEIESFRNTIIEKVRFLSKVPVIIHPMAKMEERMKNPNRIKINKPNIITPVVGIGASTGGPQALLNLIKDFPDPIPFCILIVQHIIPTFAQGLVDWLKTETKRNIKIAQTGDPIEINNIYISPGNKHLTLKNPSVIELRDDPPFKGQKPSANLLFKSMAEKLGNHCIGVILSGMGNDGLEGLKKLYEKKAPILAQNKKTSTVYGMPKECIDAGIATKVVSDINMSVEIMALQEVIK